MRGFSGTSGPFRGASPFGPFSSSLPSSDLPGLFQMPPRNDPPGSFFPRKIPSGGDSSPVPILTPGSGRSREGIQPPERVRGHRLSRLDLHGKKISFPLQEKVDLVAGPVLPEGAAGFPNSVQAPLCHCLTNCRIIGQFANDGESPPLSDSREILSDRRFQSKSPLLEIPPSFGEPRPADSAFPVHAGSFEPFHREADPGP